MKEEDLRRKKAREAIQRAFILLMYETGFNSISIASLMKRAGYSRGTFYQHFQNTWEVYEQVTRAYVEDLCRGFEVEEEGERYTMSEQACLIVLEVLQTVKAWYPYGRALLKKRENPDIFPEIVREYAWKRIHRDCILFPGATLKYIHPEDEVAREIGMSYAVTTLIAMFECAARYVTDKTSEKEMRGLAESIYAGNAAFVQYEHRMDLQMGGGQTYDRT